jgi:hypothetical protein
VVFVLFEICALINVLLRFSWIDGVRHWVFCQIVKDFLNKSAFGAV